MTTVAKLLARKQHLIEQLLDHPGPEEQDKIGRQLQKIDTALHLLDDNVPAGTSTDDQKRYGPSA
jgi:hypothetical protein